MTLASIPDVAVDLNDLVHAVLRQSPYLASRQLRFETHEGRVKLHGVVASYYQKQMAQEALRSVAGVHHIENHLQVDWA